LQNFVPESASRRTPRALCIAAAVFIMGLLILLYEVSILLARLVERSRARLVTAAAMAAAS
jgi:Sec-independent protein secretion pathway component TatC